MLVRFDCPHCHSTLRVGRRKLSTATTCPICSGTLTISTPAQPSRVGSRFGRGFPLAVLTAGIALLLISFAGLSWAMVRLVAPPAAEVAETPRPLPPAEAPTDPRPAVARIIVRTEPAVVASSEVAPPTSPAPSPAPLVTATPSEPAPLVLPQRDRASEEELRAELQRVPVVGLDPPVDLFTRDPHGQTAEKILKKAADARPEKVIHVLPDLLTGRKDLASLPLLRGSECLLERGPATQLQQLSLQMRERNFRRPNFNQYDLKGPPEGPDSGSAGAVPCLMQMLQPESAGHRQLLVRQLRDIQGPTASEGLARIALYDVSRGVRQEAVRALAVRPLAEARPTLLAGFRHPWAPVAQHAAEALVALQDREAVPALKELTAAPDPAAPFVAPMTADGSVASAPSVGAKTGTFVREMVRVNHLRNCLLCHAPSRSEKDMVRAVIPRYHPKVEEVNSDPYAVSVAEPNDFVRADVTYLRQDFSLIQKVEHPGSFAPEQRFDFVIRTRLLSAKEAAKLSLEEGSSWPQRQAVEFTLRELTSVVGGGGRTSGN